MGTAHQLDIELAIDDQARTVLVAVGDIDLTTAPMLRRRIEATAQPGDDLVIDHRGVTFMDSPGLGTLVHCDRLQRERGCRLVLKNPTGAVRELFEVVGLANVISLE